MSEWVSDDDGDWVRVIMMMMMMMWMMTMMSVWLPPETSSMLKVDEAKSDDRYRILMTRLGLEHELRGS